MGFKRWRNMWPNVNPISIITFQNMWLLRSPRRYTQQIPIVSQSDYFTNETSLSFSVITHSAKIFSRRASFAFSRNVTGNLTASFRKCYSSKNWGLALTLRVTPSVLNSLFDLWHIFVCYFPFNELLFFLYLCNIRTAFFTWLMRRRLFFNFF